MILLWAAFVVLAGLDLWSKARPSPRLETIVKPLAMVVLIVITVAAGALGSAIGVMLVVALAWCLLGDVLLLGTGEGRFLAGLTSFLVGHLAYAVGFVLIGLTHPWWAVVALVALVGVGGVAWRIVAGAALGGRGMAVAVATYIVVISAMALMGWATGQWLLGVGALVFVASDTVLGFDRFVRPLHGGGVAVMATYLLAQALLVLGFLPTT